jgi:hypothetical protein
MYIPNITTCKLSTSLHMCIHACIISCSCYQYKKITFIDICMCSKCSYLSAIKVTTCVHHSHVTSNSKFWQKASFIYYKNVLVFFSMSCSLSTSLHICIHSCIISCFHYLYNTFCIHWNEDFFWGFHCDETLNFIIQLVLWHEFHTWHEISHHDKILNIIVLVSITTQVSCTMWIFYIYWSDFIFQGFIVMKF